MAPGTEPVHALLLAAACDGPAGCLTAGDLQVGDAKHDQGEDHRLDG